MSGSTRGPHLADTNDIERWAGTTVARSELPQLMRRLVYHTNDQVLRLEMRAGEGVGSPGFDGTVLAAVASPLVPDGASVWEMGTNRDIDKKANEDYKGRTENPLGAKPEETTFVFVSPRRWDRKKEWENAKRAEGVWRDILALDVDDIDQALDEAPAVLYWLSELLGKDPSGVETIESWWSTYSRFTNPALTPDLILAGRADQAAELLRLLSQDTRHTLIRARHVDDVLAFIAATVLTTEQEASVDLLSRTLVVRDAPTLRQLDCTSQLLILLPFEDHLRRYAEQVTNHHVVFIGEDGGGADIELPDPNHDLFKNLLLTAGVDEERALQLTRAVEGGLRSFRRIASSRGTVVPPWSSHFESQITRRAWLIGSWNSRRSGDREILARSIGGSFDEIDSALTALVRDSDPLFAVSGGTWTALSVPDAWEAARNSITSSDLQATEAALQAVLGEVDPALDLPVVDRWQAGLLGKSRLYSSSIRSGLATTLAVLGSRDERAAFTSGQTGPGWAREMVAGLCSRANSDNSGQLWASLSDVMPLLAEASPEQFMTGVQGLLDSRLFDPATVLFVDATNAISVSSPHTGLLWALENIAWEEDFLPLAVDLIARLAEIDPGGRLSNRPINTLRSIFLPWFPQTYATSEDRQEVIEGLLLRHQDVGWRLLLKILPERHGTGHPSHRPSYRHGPAGAPSMEPADDSAFTSWICRRATDSALESAERICELIERSTGFPPSERRLLYTAIRNMSIESFSGVRRSSIWETAQKVIRFQLSLTESDRLLGGEELALLSEAVAGAAPVDPVNEHRWLFTSFFPDLEIRPSDDHDAYEHELRVRRASAVRTIASVAGHEGVYPLLGEDHQNWAVGVALWDALQTVERGVVKLLKTNEHAYLDFARGYVRAATGGSTDNLRQLINEWPHEPVVQARLAALADTPASIWDDLSALSDTVERLYWSEFRPYGLGADFSEVNRAVTNLLIFERPATAVDLISLYSRNAGRVDPEIAAVALEELLDHDDPEIARLRDYGLASALDVARSGNVEGDRIAILEWRLLPALGIDAYTPALALRLARDPEFFVHMVRLFALPASGEDDMDADSSMAMNAYRLLQDWNVVPGSTGPTQQTEYSALSSWVEEARRLLSDADRSSAGDQFIGHVFAKSTSDDDGTWPERPVRDVMEQVASVDIENGFYVATLNSRGATSRGLLDGGAQERELVRNYGQLSKNISKRWPRVSAVLRSIADSYEREAAEQDRQSAARKRGVRDER